MKWRKLGLVYCPDGSSSWAKHSALMPNAIDLDDRLRLFLVFRDETGAGRAGYVDLEKNDPTKVMGVSQDPVLDIGKPGMFDDNGTMPSCIYKTVDERGSTVYRLFYSGYQLGVKVRHLIFPGMAYSYDCTNFIKLHETPVADRIPECPLVRGIHGIFKKGDKYRWVLNHGCSNGWMTARGVEKSIYTVFFADSDSDLYPQGPYREVIPLKEGEYRAARPSIIVGDDGIHHMLYGISTEKDPYVMGYARSTDGETWERRDDESGLPLSEHGWDSEQIAYPNIIRCEDKVYCFYNGNDMGRTGFGVAVLESW